MTAIDMTSKRLALLPFLGTALLYSACDDPDDDRPSTDSQAMTESAGGEDDEPAADTDADMPGDDVTESDTDGDSPDDPTAADADDSPPQDCSCYDPAVDVALEFDAQCLGVEAALPGCAVDPDPCPSILESEDDETGESTAGPLDAVVCLADQLASGQRPSFILQSETFQDSVTAEFFPFGDALYVSYDCEFFDKPPRTQGVRTYEVSDAMYFEACAADNSDDATAMLACIRAGFNTTEEGAMTACE